MITKHCKFITRNKNLSISQICWRKDLTSSKDQVFILYSKPSLNTIFGFMSTWFLICVKADYISGVHAITSTFAMNRAVMTPTNSFLAYWLLLWWYSFFLCFMYHSLLKMLTHCWPDCHFIKYTPVPGHFTHFKCSTPQYILTYNLAVWMILLNPALKKLHIESLLVSNWQVCLKTTPSVKRNKAEFMYVPSFTLLLCGMHFTMSCRILLLALSTSKKSV